MDSQSLLNTPPHCPEPSQKPCPSDLRVLLYRKGGGRRAPYLTDSGRESLRHAERELGNQQVGQQASGKWKEQGHLRPCREGPRGLSLPGVERGTVRQRHEGGYHLPSKPVTHWPQHPGPPTSCSALLPPPWFCTRQRQPSGLVSHTPRLGQSLHPLTHRRHHRTLAFQWEIRKLVIWGVQGGGHRATAGLG